jgi:hypothetical protein
MNYKQAVLTAAVMVVTNMILRQVAPDLVNGTSARRFFN